MEIHSYFSSLIGFVYNPEHSKLEKKLIKKCFKLKEKIKKGGNNWLSKNTYNTLSTYNLINDKDFLPLQNFINKSVLNYCNELKIDTSNLNKSPNYGWFNLYNKYDYQEYHIHGDSIISTIYFLKCDDDSARTFFKTTINEMSKIKYIEKNHLTYKDIQIVPKPGLLVIFDSSLPHCVEQHMSKEPRISLAYNYKELN